MKNLALSVALCLVASTVAHGGVQVALDYYGFADENGDLLTTNSKVVMVIDKDGDGLAGFGLTASPATQNAPTDTFLLDADDVIVPDWNEETGDYGSSAYCLSTSYDFDLGSGIDADDHIFVFWYPGLGISATEPGTGPSGAGQVFGVIECTNQGLPPDNNSYTFSDLNDTWEGSQTAVYSTAPEPATIALMLVGSGLALLRRRRA